MGKYSMSSLGLLPRPLADNRPHCRSGDGSIRLGRPLLSSDLLPELSEFNSGVDIRKFLVRLLVLVTKGRISSRRAAALAYISNQLLHSHRPSPGDLPARQC
jgi:hypothetical protein